MRPCSAFLAGLLFLARGLAAQPLGGEFRVDTYTTASAREARVAFDGSGHFVVVWTGYGEDGSGSGIFARRFDVGGMPLGQGFQVNSYTTSDQRWPSVAGLGPGFVVVWQANGTDGHGAGIVGQRYDGGGDPLGGEFLVNTYTTLDQIFPAVAADAAGGFFVVWRSSGDGSGWGVFGQRFDSLGAPAGNEFRVNTYTSADQGFASVASDSSGFLVVWTSDGQDGSLDGVFGQRFDSAGVSLGPEFRVNTSTTNYQNFPVVAPLGSAGGFVVVWQSRDNAAAAVFAQRLDASGAPLGGEFQIGAHTTASQYGPAVTSDASGNFVIAFTDTLQDGNVYGVFAQRYESGGAPAGDEFQVNSATTGYQVATGVGGAADGSFVVAWAGFSTNLRPSESYGVHAQRYGSIGCMLPDAAVPVVSAPPPLVLTQTFCQ